MPIKFALPGLARFRAALPVARQPPIIDAGRITGYATDVITVLVREPWSSSRDLRAALYVAVPVADHPDHARVGADLALFHRVRVASNPTPST